MDPFRLGISSVGSFQKMAFSQSLFLWLFSFLYFNAPDRGVEVGPTTKIIEVCLYLLTLFPGNDWGTSLISSPSAPVWSQHNLFVNTF